MVHSLNRFGGSDALFYGRPLDIEWGGWRSNTATLQRAGWSLSADQDLMRCSIRVALRHEEFQCYGITAPLDMDYYLARQAIVLPPLRVVCFGTRLTVTIAEMGIPNFQPIDAAPQYIKREVRNIEDLKWFAVPLVRTEEIIVDPLTVADMLEKIREMQAPEQQAIRQRNRLRENREGMDMSAAPMPKQNFHAQILSIAA